MLAVDFLEEDFCWLSLAELSLAELFEGEPFDEVFLGAVLFEVLFGALFSVEAFLLELLCAVLAFLVVEPAAKVGAGSAVTRTVASR